jgi:uncharacterized protein DUF6152
MQFRVEAGKHKMTIRRTVWSIVLLAAAFVAPLNAHHSIAGIYDTSKAVAIRGLITMLEWRNPHSFVFFSARDDNGKITDWRVELASVTTMTSGGLDKDLIDLTKTYSMQIFPARDGSKSAVGVTLTFEGGKTYEVIDKATLPPATK